MHLWVHPWVHLWVSSRPAALPSCTSTEAISGCSAPDANCPSTGACTAVWSRLRVRRTFRRVQRTKELLMQTVLISGGGIAGPVLAHWLHRHGFRATVVERAPGPRPGGQAVDVRGVALDVVERMGLL